MFRQRYNGRQRVHKKGESRDIPCDPTLATQMRCPRRHEVEITEDRASFPYFMTFLIAPTLGRTIETRHYRSHTTCDTFVCVVRLAVYLNVSLVGW